MTIIKDRTICGEAIDDLVYRKEGISMAKKERTKISLLKEKLGDLAYRIGKQQEVANDEIRKLQELQKKANEVATEIETLDGK